MKNFEAKELLKGLTVLKDVKLPVKIAYAVLKNIDKLSSVDKLVEETRVKIIEDVCEKGDDGKPLFDEVDGQKVYKLSDEAKENFNKQYIDLLNMEAGVELHKIDEHEITEDKDLKLTLEQASYLLKITNNGTQP